MRRSKRLARRGDRGAAAEEAEGLCGEASRGAAAGKARKKGALAASAFTGGSACDSSVGPSAAGSNELCELASGKVSWTSRSKNEPSYPWADGSPLAAGVCETWMVPKVLSADG